MSFKADLENLPLILELTDLKAKEIHEVIIAYFDRVDPNLYECETTPKTAGETVNLYVRSTKSKKTTDAPTAKPQIAIQKQHSGEQQITLMIAGQIALKHTADEKTSAQDLAVQLLAKFYPEHAHFNQEAQEPRDAAAAM